jgi:hypothetical protein
MADFNIDAIIAEFGARYTPEGQAAKDIKTQLFQPSETEAFFMTRPNDGDYYKSAFATIDEVTQAFSIPFAVKGGASFDGWETKIGEFKVDQLFTPDKFRNSWLGFLATIKEVDRSKWPVLMWYVRELLLPKINEEMELEQSYYGWQVTGYDAGTPTVNGTTFERELLNNTTASDANAAMDGIRVLIGKAVAATRANVINTGAHSTNAVTFVEEIEAFVQEIEPKLRRKCDYLFMSETLANRYADGRREKYNMYYAQVGDLMEIDKSPLKVQKLHSMDGAEKIWTTPAMNRIRPIAKDSNGIFDMQKLDRTVKVLNDWKKGLAFDVPEFIVTNDLENTIGAPEIAARY